MAPPVSKGAGPGSSESPRGPFGGSRSQHAPPFLSEDPYFFDSRTAARLPFSGFACCFPHLFHENRRGAWQSCPWRTGSHAPLRRGVLGAGHSCACVFCSFFFFLRRFCLLPLLILFFFFPSLW